MRRLPLAVAAAAALALPAGSVSVSTPGVTSTQVLLGGTVPLSGPASPFGVVGAGANAYFRYVNAHGGVNKRKIKYVYRDDGYDPSRTVEQTRELVQSDKVFAIFNSVGTEHVLLALLEDDGAAGTALQDAGVQRAPLEAWIIEELSAITR